MINSIFKFFLYYLSVLVFAVLLVFVLTSCSDKENEEFGIIDFQKVFIFPEYEQEKLYNFAANTFIEQVKREPNSVIVLPTGSTPLGMYKKIIEKFKNDKTIDFSKVKFFNLDEYVGLSESHPLSYHYYMKVNFYDPLRYIDAKRAPVEKNIYIPSKEKGASWYEMQYRKAIKSRPLGKADLVILGLGGAYPVKTKDSSGNEVMELKGGHIAFNEPGSDINSKVRLVSLSEKTKKDTAFRFKSLKYLRGELAKNKIDHDNVTEYSDKVPGTAITMGIADILSSRAIMVLATGEEKSPVIKYIFENNISPNFPSSYLKRHDNVTYLIDSAASSMLSYEPWRRSNKVDKKYKERIWKGMISGFKTHGSIKEVLYDRDAATEALKGDGDAEDAKIRLLAQLREKLLHGMKNDLILRDRADDAAKTVLVVSPHPDDDVISMAATIKRLLNEGNKVYILYAVSGENGVSEDDAAFKKYFNYLSTIQDNDLRIRSAKEKVREDEAIRATSVLGVSSNNLRFMKFDYYYRRGIPKIKAITETDKNRMLSVLKEVNPDVIFFAAENDPHGAHGLSKKLLAYSLKDFREKVNNKKDITLYGYRGAYAEWPLSEPDDLLIVPFDQNLQNLKSIAIKEHKSQLSPVFPSFDPRPFYKRARDRNRNQAKLLATILRDHSIGDYVEVFKKFDENWFINKMLIN